MDRAAVHESEHFRESTLAPLARQLAGVALRRTGLAAALWGEAGIGKTQACQDLLRGLICRSVSVHASLPFAALVAALPRPRTLGAWLEQSLDRLQAGQEAENADPLAVFSGQLLHGMFDIYWSSGLTPLPFIAIGMALAERGPHRRAA